MDQTVEMVEYLKEQGVQVSVAGFYGALIKRAFTEYQGGKDEFLKDIGPYLPKPGHGSNS